MDEYFRSLVHAIEENTAALKLVHAGMVGTAMEKLQAENTAQADKPEPAPTQPENPELTTGAPTIEDARDVLLTLKAAKDRETVLDLLSGYVPKDAAPNIGGVPKDRYAELIAEAQKLAGE